MYEDLIAILLPFRKPITHTQYALWWHTRGAQSIHTYYTIDYVIYSIYDRSINFDVDYTLEISFGETRLSQVYELTVCLHWWS